MKLNYLLERGVSGTENMYRKDVKAPLKNWPGNKGDKSKLRGAVQPPGKAKSRKKRSIWTKELEEDAWAVDPGTKVDFYDDGQDAWTDGEVVSKDNSGMTVKFKDSFGKEQNRTVEKQHVSNAIRPVKGENAPHSY